MQFGVLGLAATAGRIAICSGQGPLSDAISTTESLFVQRSFLDQTPANQSELLVEAINEEVDPDKISVLKTIEITKNATPGLCIAPGPSRIPSAIPTNRLRLKSKADLRIPSLSPISQPKTKPKPETKTTQADLDDLIGPPTCVPLL